MKFIRYSIILLICFPCVFLLDSCSRCNRQQTIEDVSLEIDLSGLSADSFYISMGHKILYSMPTPIEASMLIKNWGVPGATLMNDPANVSGYLTKKKMALNFGVYITDMSTAGLYEQAQTVLSYKKAIVQLIDGLGLQAAIDSKIMQKIEDNVHNKNELLNIISDVYASCTQYLTEDDRRFYALAILTGGWIEGMYIATSMIDEKQTSNQDKIKTLISDNKKTFDLLWEELSRLDDIPEDAASLMFDMSYIAHLFGHETLVSFPIKSENIDIDNISPQFFAELKNYIHQLRYQFTKK